METGASRTLNLPSLLGTDVLCAGSRLMYSVVALLQPPRYVCLDISGKIMGPDILILFYLSYRVSHCCPRHPFAPPVSPRHRVLAWKTRPGYWSYRVPYRVLDCPLPSASLHPPFVRRTG
jgi:hypothetical protein